MFPWSYPGHMQVRHLPVLVKLRQHTACLDPAYGVTSFSFPLSNAGVRVGVCTPAEELEPFIDFGVDGNCVHSIALTCFLNEFLGGGGGGVDHLYYRGAITGVQAPRPVADQLQ